MRKITVLICALSMVMLCSCNTSPDTPQADHTEAEHEKTLFAMDTYMSLKAYGENGGNVLEKAALQITELEDMLSVTESGSEISQINSADTAAVGISDDTTELLKASLALNKETNGAFDITLYPVSQEWGFTTNDHHIPDDKRLEELLANTGCDKIHLDDAVQKASLDKNVSIDLGGIAKGYAGKIAAETLKRNNIKSALLNMGGNVQTVGAKPDGSAWKVGIQDPEDESLLAGSVEVIDKAVITSGGYERFFIGQDGKKYHHIIDPKTGRPAENGIISSTVIGDDGALCDALSTSFYIMGVDGASEYLSRHHETDAVLIGDDNTLYITKGIEQAFEPLNSFTDARIVVIGKTG